MKKKTTKVEAPKVEAPKVEAPKVEAPKVEAPKVDNRITPLKIVKCEYHAGTAKTHEGKEVNKHVITSYVLRVKYATKDGTAGEWFNAASDPALTYKGFGASFRDKLAANKARLELCSEVGIAWKTRDEEYTKVCAEFAEREAERAKKRKENAQNVIAKGEKAYMKKGKELRQESWKRLLERANG